MQPARLLFIDDDVAVCDVMRTTLTHRGFEVVCVNSGAAALAALEHEEFDAVVTDLNMPGMSGLELCQRAHASWPNLPIVLVTAFGSMETAVGAEAWPSGDHVWNGHKPPSVPNPKNITGKSHICVETGIL